MNPKSLLIAFCLFFGTFHANADSLNYSPVQFNFLSPIGTHGIYSTNYLFNFSIGALSNHSGGIKGFEVAGLYNYTKTNMNGFQTAGLFNWVRNESNGFQVSGLFNSTKKAKGVQISGLINSASEGFRGLQISGLISNANNKTYPTNSLDFNTQISGLYSRGKGFNQFVQISGLVSVAEEIKSTQISGLVNTSTGNEGVQIAGLYNQSKKVKGVQIAFINKADSVEGYQIGAFNTSKKNGMYAWEYGVSDNFNLFASYRSGVNNLYNFLSIGLKYNQGISWGYGYGIGIYLDEYSKYRTFTEFSAYHITEDKIWENKYSNFLLNVGYGIEFGKKNDRKNFRIMPNVNVFLAKTKDGRLNKFPETIYPYYSVIAKTTQTDVHIWLGLKASMRILK